MTGRMSSRCTQTYGREANMPTFAILYPWQVVAIAAGTLAIIVMITFRPKRG